MCFTAKSFSFGFAACVMLMVTMNSGCAPDQRADYVFQVTDASTGKPLPGVAVSGYGNGHYHNNRLFPSLEKFDLLTNDQGEVTINGVLTVGFQYFFDFEKPGFSAMIFYGSPSAGESQWLLVYKDSDKLPSKDTFEERWALHAGRLARIKMYPLGSSIRGGQ